MAVPPLPTGHQVRRLLRRASYASGVGVCTLPAGQCRADDAMAREQAYGSTVRATSRTTTILKERRLKTNWAWRLVAGCR